MMARVTLNVTASVDTVYHQLFIEIYTLHYSKYSTVVAN